MIFQLKQFLWLRYSGLKYRCQEKFGKEREGTKVFCIGYLKTGTTSLGVALKKLGYKHASFNMAIWNAYKKGRTDRVLQFAEKFDSFDDIPWLYTDLFPILNEKFPGSRFIYLERDEEDWLQSYERWQVNDIGAKVDRKKALEDYKRHRDFVLEYFQGNKDFLKLNVSEADAFEKLAEFLGKKAPSKKLPHLNKGRY